MTENAYFYFSQKHAHKIAEQGRSVFEENGRPYTLKLIYHNTLQLIDAKNEYKDSYADMFEVYATGECNHTPDYGF